MKNGYYSLVQFCPNPSRAEAANIGVLLFCPDIQFMDVKISKTNERIRRFFGDQDIDLAFLKFARESLRERVSLRKDKLETVDEFEKFIKTRVNEIRLTTPRSIKVDNPKVDIEVLYKDLVEEIELHHARKLRSFPEVETFFKRPTLDKKLNRNISVELPILRKEIRIPYAFQNGTRNLIQPLRLTLDNQGIDKVLRTACEGDLLQKHKAKGIGNKFIVILLTRKIASAKHSTYSEEDFEKAFQEYAIRTVKQNGLDEYADEIEEVLSRRCG